MVDLRVDTGAIRRSQATFGDIRDRLESAVAGFESVSGSTVAQDELRRRLDELGSSWGVGIKKLGEFAAAAGTALGGVADAFDGVDDELARALEARPTSSPAPSSTHGPRAV